MNILHYTLGFPPFRSGGLTKYALDLMLAERSLGHDVTMIYPGNASCMSKISEISKCESFHGINVYKLKNGLPVPLLYGIRNPQLFMEHREIMFFDDFMSTVKPNVLHIHTLMGLPIEILRLFKEARVRIVLTSHDYFGLCPQVNFINNEGKVCNQADALRCETCNENAWPAWLLKIRNAESLVPFIELLR